MSAPSTSRTPWGTMSPTNPIGPVWATTTPVRSDAATNTMRLTRSASTPSWSADSSPSASRFSARACAYTIAVPTAAPTR